MSFAKRNLEDAKSGFWLNSAYPIVGGLISILLGLAFLAIALLFIATLLKEKRALRKVGRAPDWQSNPVGGGINYSATRSRQGDWSGPGVAFRKREVPEERAVLVSDRSDL
jgi:hypothetical protein